MAKKFKEDPEREDRITYDIIVDCYDEHEQAMGWYCYLEDKLKFPFQAKVAKKSSASPLRVGEVVKITGMADTDDCLGTMLVMATFGDRTCGVPLEQLEPIKSNATTKQAIEDWTYYFEKCGGQPF